MKAKDLQVGVVYGYRRGKYDSPDPALLLAVEVWERQFHYNKPATFRKAPSGQKPGRGRGYSAPDYGYPVLLADVGILAGLDDVTMDHVAAGLVTLLDGARIAVVNPVHLLGPWDEVSAEHEAAERAEREQRARENAERDARRKATIAAAARADRLGLECRFDPDRGEIILWAATASDWLDRIEQTGAAR